MENLTQVLNLNKYEYAFLKELIKGEVLTATEISKLTEIPRSRVYDVGEKLEARGFVKCHDKKVIETTKTTYLNKKRNIKKILPKSFELASLESIKESIKKSIEVQMNEKMKALDVLYS